MLFMPPLAITECQEIRFRLPWPTHAKDSIYNFYHCAKKYEIIYMIRARLFLTLKKLVLTQKDVRL